MDARSLHELGNDHYTRGDWGGAIRHYLKVLELSPCEETKYNLGLAYIRNREYGKALEAFGEFERKNPDDAQVQYCLGLAWQYKGDQLKAAKHYQRCVSLDPEYKMGRKQERWHTISSIRTRIEANPLVEWLDSATAADGELGEVLDDARREFGRFTRLVARPSCDIRCGSLCCHFDGEPWRWGVMIEPSKVHVLRKHLLERKLSPDSYLGRVDADTVENEEEVGKLLLRKNYVIEESERRVVYYPKAGEHRLTEQILKYTPKALDYEKVPWIKCGSQGCTFICDSGCLVHDVSGPQPDEPGLDICRRWVCLTGYVAIILRELGILTGEHSASKDMEQLNKLAVEALKPLLEHIFENRENVELEEEALESLKKASKDGKNGATLERCRILQKRRIKLIKEESGKIRSALLRHL